MRYIIALATATLIVVTAWPYLRMYMPRRQQQGEPKCPPMKMTDPRIMKTTAIATVVTCGLLIGYLIAQVSTTLADSAGQ